VIVLRNIWEWLKKYWRWLLFPVGIISSIIVFLLGRSSKQTTTQVVSPALVGAEEVKAKAGLLAEQQAMEADLKRQQQLQALEQEHADLLKKLDNKQRSRVTELLDDPEALNAYLLQVSQDIRG